ncbi:hypothetical protein BV25DRAFT_1990015 [Artomyces pyxidatus]|uniref:Uncharacterized protein n=1 Tax=Artomyces pyxidatus TaxID=48021 RepID=A0ACB8T7X6_9AGAM|nr:hypothetical protein BV25DRAFT_1990015 [Artomyces pyxidatus]
MHHEDDLTKGHPETNLVDVDPPSTSTAPAIPDPLDWDALRRRSLQPGGFGTERQSIWPRLLHVDPATLVAAQSSVPSADSEETPHEDERQIRLDTDRSFVLYPVDEKSVNREQRQQELNTLIVQIFRRHPGLSYFQAHPTYAALLEEQSPLPYSALSHLLTLFAHDVPTLPLIQHLFDFLLARHPIAVVYVAAAVTLARKDEVELLEKEGEEGMIHSILTGLPDLVDGVGDEENEEHNQEETISGILVGLDDQPPEAAPAVKMEDSKPSVEVDTEEAKVELKQEFDASPEISVKQEPEDIPSIVEKSDVPVEEFAGVSVNSEVELATSLDQFAAPVDPPSYDSPPSTPSPPEFGEPPVPPTLLKQSRSVSPELSPTRPQRPTRSLPALLEHADTLLSLYPPSHPALELEHIMGPASAMRTWSENPAQLPPDDAAEAFVVLGRDIVLPWVPEPEPDSNEEEEMSTEKSWFGRRKKGKKPERRRRKLQKRHRPVFGALVERRTMLAGAALVMGVAMAVSIYGLHGRGGGVGGMDPDWRRTGRVLGGLVGIGERVWAAIGGTEGMTGF